MPHLIQPEDLQLFDAALHHRGIDGAIAYLNSRTPHRFTGIFRFEGNQLDNTFLFDREDSTAARWAPRPVSDSYCSIIQATGLAFVLANSALDPRVADHTARGRIIAYCGVPLREETGELYGSLCHFDYKPVLFSDVDLPFLQSVAPFLARALLNR